MKERISLKHIKPNPANPRIIRDGKFADLKRSIAQFPQMLEARGIAVMLEGGKYVALGGNQRYRALVDLQTEIESPDFERKYKCTSDSFFKLKSYFDSGVPIENCTAWTDEQKRRFIIADNLPFGEWDTDALANEWDVDELREWGMPDFIFGGEVVADSSIPDTLTDEKKSNAIKVVISIPDIETLDNFESKLKELVSIFDNVSYSVSGFEL